MKSLRLKTTLNIDIEIVYKESQLLQHIGSQRFATHLTLLRDLSHSYSAEKNRKY